MKRSVLFGFWPLPFTTRSHSSLSPVLSLQVYCWIGPFCYPLPSAGRSTHFPVITLWSNTSVLVENCTPVAAAERVLAAALALALALADGAVFVGVFFSTDGM